MNRRRRADRHPLCINIPIEARDILRRVSGQHGRTQGQLVAQLLFEYGARLDEREKLRAELNAVGCTHLAAEHIGL